METSPLRSIRIRFCLGNFGEKASFQTSKDLKRLSTSSGVDDESLINRPGLVIPYNDESAPPTRAAGVEVSQSVFQAFDRMLSLFDKLSGINEVSQGSQ